MLLIVALFDRLADIRVRLGIKPPPVGLNLGMVIADVQVLGISAPSLVRNAA
jgi:hypothetical protein